MIKSFFRKEITLPKNAIKDVRLALLVGYLLLSLYGATWFIIAFILNSPFDGNVSARSGLLEIILINIMNIYLYPYLFVMNFIGLEDESLIYNVGQIPAGAIALFSMFTYNSLLAYISIKIFKKIRKIGGK